MFKVQHSYTADSKTDIHLKVGDVITHVEDVGNGWSLGYNISSGKTGTFPSEFIQKRESIRKRISRLSTVKKRSNQIKLESVKVKSTIELPLPEGEAVIPRDVLQRRLTYAPSTKKLIRIKNPTETTKTVKKEKSELLNGKNNALKYMYQVLKTLLALLFGCLACGVLFVLLHFCYEYSFEVSKWITVGCSVPILLGMMFSIHFRCIMLLIVPGFFSGKGQAIFLSMIFVQLLAGPVVNIAYNAEQASGSMACAQELIYTQSVILKNQLEAPIRRIEKTIWNGLQKVKEVADNINDFIEPVFGVIDSFTSGLDQAKNALHNAAQKCSQKIEEAQSRCENGIIGARENCLRDIRKYDPAKYAEKGYKIVKDWTKKTAKKVDKFFRSLGKKRRRRAVTEEEKQAIERVMSLRDRNLRIMNKLDGKTDQDSKYFYPGKTGTSGTVTTGTDRSMRGKLNTGNKSEGKMNQSSKYFYRRIPDTSGTLTTSTGKPKETHQQRDITDIGNMLDGKTDLGSKYFYGGKVYRGNPDTSGTLTTSTGKPKETHQQREITDIGNMLDGKTDLGSKYFYGGKVYRGNPDTSGTLTTSTRKPKETNQQREITDIGNKLDGKTNQASKYFYGGKVYRGNQDTSGTLTTSTRKPKETLKRKIPDIEVTFDGKTDLGSKYYISDTRMALFKTHRKQHALQRYKRDWCSFCWTCNILRLEFICKVVKIGEYVACKPMKYVSRGIKSVNHKIKETVNAVKSFFGFDFEGNFDRNAKANSSKTATQIVSEVKEDILAKIEGIRKVSNIITNVLTSTLLLLFIQTALYLKKFLSKDNFENFYITRSFKHFNQKQEENGEESVLPLKRKEMSKYVDTRSPWLAQTELQTAKKGLAKLVIHFLIAVVIIFFDYILHFVLSLIDRYGNLNINIEGNTYLEVSVDGTGFIAAFLRALLSTVDLDTDFGVQFNLSTCIPKPSQPDEGHLYKFGILYGAAFIFLFIQAYSLRLRRKIATWFFPDQDEARNRYLYEKIRQKRIAFSSWIRQHIMSRDKQFKLENQMSLRNWLQFNHPKIARYICCCLRYKKKCLNCDLAYDKFQRFHKCTNCLSNYCEFCFQKELKSKCVICDKWDKVAKRNTDIFK